MVSTDKYDNLLAKAMLLSKEFLILNERRIEIKRLEVDAGVLTKIRYKIENGILILRTMNNLIKSKKLQQKMQEEAEKILDSK